MWGVDAWVTLAAAAVRTGRIRLGTMITPLSRMRPWKLASETTTLDNLSNGRVILSVGLGATDTGFEAFGEVTDRRTRAELLDEGLDILTGLWRGQPFRYQGKHYHIKETTFSPPPQPVQKPHIPIWVVGAWFSEKSMQRAATYDGLLPNMLGGDGRVQMRMPAADEIRAMKIWIGEHRTSATPFDIVLEQHTPGDDPARAASIARSWADAGATWLLEADWTAQGPGPVLDRVRQGPPRGK